MKEVGCPPDSDIDGNVVTRDCSLSQIQLQRCLVLSHEYLRNHVNDTIDEGLKKEQATLGNKYSIAQDHIMKNKTAEKKLMKKVYGQESDNYNGEALLPKHFDSLTKSEIQSYVYVHTCRGCERNRIC